MNRKINYKRIVIVVLGLFFTFSYLRQEMAINRLSKEYEKKVAELEILRQDSERLQEEVEKSKTDEYIEALARDKLKMIKPGEKVVNDK